MAGYEPHFTGNYWIFPKGQSVAMGELADSIWIENAGLFI